MRKGGFEPPRLTAPPPQDGASASSATSARGKVRKNLSTFYKSGQRSEPRSVSATSTAPVSLELALMEQASSHQEQGLPPLGQVLPHY